MVLILLSHEKSVLVSRMEERERPLGLLPLVLEAQSFSLVQYTIVLFQQTKDRSL